MGSLDFPGVADLELGCTAESAGFDRPAVRPKVGGAAVG